MVPLVSITAEHVQTREVIERVIAEVSAEEGVELNIPVGTMLELPRACMVADEIAQHADFFCFGTNDLTQTTFGFSRDDAEAKFIPLYMHKKILKDNPFETIDSAVLELVRMAVEKGRATNPGMHFGVCGEHGGDPKSIKGLFNVADVDYVSCSALPRAPGAPGCRSGQARGQAFRLTEPRSICAFYAPLRAVAPPVDAAAFYVGPIHWQLTGGLR